jgi:hypothetical protein
VAGGFLLEVFSGRDAGAFDLVRLLLLYPLSALILAGLMGFWLATAERTGWVQALERRRHAWALLFVPGLLEGAITMVLRRPAPGFVTAPEAFVSLVTAGFFPRPLAAAGVSLGLLVALIWFARELRRLVQPTKSIVAAVGSTYAAAMALLLVPSVLGWIGQFVGALATDAASVPRGFVRLSLDGYWWQQVYERFPLVTGGEAALSGQYLLAALLFLGGMMVVQFLPPWRGMGLRRRLEAVHLWRGWPFVAAVVLGLGVALAGVKAGRTVFSDGVAWLVAVGTAWELWVAAVFHRDLCSLRDDELNRPERPLLTGEWRLEDVEEARVLHGALGLLGAWILGLPVFLPVLVAVLMGHASLAERLRPSERPQEGPWFLVATIATFVAAWFFGVGHGHLAPSLGRGVGGWTLLMLGWAFFLFPSFRQTMESRFRLILGGLAGGVAPGVAMALLFLGLPLFFASGTWFLFGAVFWAAGMVCLWQRETAQKRVFQLAVLYAFLCGLLAASHGLIS